MKLFIFLFPTFHVFFVFELLACTCSSFTLFVHERWMLNNIEYFYR